jgi:iron(III) transport system substrate-binding protein
MRSFYNSENVTEEDLANLDSWMDFIDDERWHGRLVTANLADESSDGTSTDLARLWLAHGQEFFDRLFSENPPTIAPTGNARLIVDGLARGEWDFCFFCDIVTADATAAAADGLPIVQNRKTFEEGPATDLTGHFGVFDQAPHPAAAQLFVNWILSKEGQTAINELIDPEVSLGVTALRKDVPQGNIPDETWTVVSDPDYVPAIVDEQLIDQSADEAHTYVIQLVTDLGLSPAG